ncbi:pentapeptide repeat-containing protein [Dactylosporangium darangshiense]|uniref:pentapeptide repeat-containing protein n=1 Tax=Dactylosporangium darangshiense TaxID=579108 RepID=UPI0031E8C0AF
MGLFGAATALVGLLPWSELVRIVSTTAAVRLVLLGLATACLVAAFRLRPVYRFSPLTPPGVRMMRTVSAWWMVVAASAVLLAMWATTNWLLRDARSAADPASARIEAVRTGLTGAGGVGAAAALMLAFRRQRHQEAAAVGIEHDAAEKRVTELYVKSAEQLGSDKAAVRMAGLLALERLAQGNPEHRQTIVDLLCAYLRMPLADAAGSEDDNERHVRRAAQGVICRHLRMSGPPDSLWLDVDVDLTGAALFDWNLHGCRLRDATFINVTFVGEAYFGSATFEGFAVFGGAQFQADAWFRGCDFEADAWFVDTRFGAAAHFTEASFRARVSFAKASFSAEVSFDDATFSDEPDMAGAVAQLETTTVLPPGWQLKPNDQGSAGFVKTVTGDESS